MQACFPTSERTHKKRAQVWMDRSPTESFWRPEDSNHHSNRSHSLQARKRHNGYFWWKPNWPWRWLISEDRTWLLWEQIIDRYRETIFANRKRGVGCRIHQYQAAHVLTWSTTLSASNSPRIERIMMKMQNLDFTAIHIPGKSNMTDNLSRHPLPETQKTENHQISNLRRQHTPQVDESIRNQEMSQKRPRLNTVLWPESRNVSIWRRPAEARQNHPTGITPRQDNHHSSQARSPRHLKNQRTHQKEVLVS